MYIPRTIGYQNSQYLMVSHFTLTNNFVCLHFLQDQIVPLKKKDVQWTMSIKQIQFPEIPHIKSPLNFKLVYVSLKWSFDFALKLTNIIGEKKLSFNYQKYLIGLKHQIKQIIVHYK